MRRPRFDRLVLRPLGTALLLIALALLVPAAAEAQPEQLPQAYLPLIARSGSVGIEFATSVNPETIAPNNPGASFAAGTDLVYVVVRLGGLAGSTLRVDLKSPRGDVTGSTSTIPLNNTITARSYCFTTTSCDSSREPFPGGRYTAEVYIDGVLWASDQFTVQ